MSSKDELPLLVKYDCLTEYDKITDCIKINPDRINRCDVNIINIASNY